MATANKVLGKVHPSATTNTTLYTVPGSTQANVNIFIANQDADTTIRVALVKSGGTIANTDYIVYDMIISKNFPVNITGIALATGDFIVVYTAAATVSFVATGIEIS